MIHAMTQPPATPLTMEIARIGLANARVKRFTDCGPLAYLDCADDFNHSMLVFPST